MDKKPILFNQSNGYFPYEDVLQNKLDFSSPLNIDIYIKQSYGILTDRVMLTGGEVECFSKNHLIEEHFLCYKIEGLNQTKITSAVGKITCKIIKKGLFKNGLIQGFIEGTPIISLLLLSFLTSVAPPQIARILTYISLIGLLITCCFYGVKMVKALLRTAVSKEIDYNGLGVICENREENKLITNEFVEIIKELDKTQNIEKVVIWEGNIFFKQTIYEKTIRETIKAKFKQEKPTQAIYIYQERIKQTIDYLLNQNFFI